MEETPMQGASWLPPACAGGAFVQWPRLALGIRQNTISVTTWA